MDITGIRLYAVLDKDGDVLDVRCAFTAAIWNHISLYQFRRKLAGQQLNTVSNAIAASQHLRGTKEKIVVLGKEPHDVKNQQVGAGPHDLAPNGLTDAQIKILPNPGVFRRGLALATEGRLMDAKTFFVIVALKQKKGANDIVVEVPFRGGPGDEAFTVRDGEIARTAEGQQDVAKQTRELMSIGVKP